MIFFLVSMILGLVILTLFSILSEKMDTDSLSSSVFECGYSSYYFSRFSFSMHYYTIGLIFLFLDLELCYLMPFFNMDLADFKMMAQMWIFIMILVVGLIEEWSFNMLDWKF